MRDRRRAKCDHPSRNENVPGQRARSTPGRSLGMPASHTPTSLVEVCRQKPARFVGSSAYTPTVSFPRRWLSMTASVNGGLPCLLADLLPILRTAFVDSLPVLQGRRHISVPAVIVVPSPCVDIFSPRNRLRNSAILRRARSSLSTGCTISTALAGSGFSGASCGIGML